VIIELDHVQVAAPIGSEGAARRLYGELLGLSELEARGPPGSRRRLVCLPNRADRRQLTSRSAKVKPTHFANTIISIWRRAAPAPLPASASSPSPGALPRADCPAGSLSGRPPSCPPGLGSPTSSPAIAAAPSWERSRGHARPSRCDELRTVGADRRPARRRSFPTGKLLRLTASSVVSLRTKLQADPAPSGTRRAQPSREIEWRYDQAR
jgi:hypothetical protein